MGETQIKTPQTPSVEPTTSPTVRTMPLKKAAKKYTALVKILEAVKSKSTDALTYSELISIIVTSINTTRAYAGAILRDLIDYKIVEKIDRAKYRVNIEILEKTIQAAK
jgi:hypothetical protein